MNRASVQHWLVRLSVLGLLVAGASTAGCDLLGADANEAPPGVGNWKVTSIDGTPPDRPRFWAITPETWVVVKKSTDGECTVLSRAPILRRDGNVVTVEFSADATFRLRLDASGDRLTSTLLSGPGNANEVVAAEAIGFNPFNRLDC